MLSAVSKKARTPRPPVQAPKRRDTRSGGLGSIPRWAIIVGVVAVAAIVVGVVLATTGGGGSSGVQSKLEAAGCTYKEVKPYPPKNGTNYHADSPKLTTKVRW